MEDVRSGPNAVTLLLLDTQHYGTLIAQVFFGLWLLPLGYLSYKSGMFAKWLGVLLIAGGVCYVIDLLAAFLAPGFGQTIHPIISSFRRHSRKSQWSYISSSLG